MLNVSLRKVVAYAFGLLFFGLTAGASENFAAKPFAQEVWLPEPKQWVVTPWYEYTEFQKIWRGTHQEKITTGDGHGFDQNDGIIMVEYGIKTNWAADLHLGATSLATRSFSSPKGSVIKTFGMMDTTFGVRWQVFQESKFVPTVTLRAGGIYRGTYNKDFPFAPGTGSVGVEPSVLASKSFGWVGFGMYANLGYRNPRSGGNSQVFGSVGFTQKYKGFTFNAGYRHQQNTSGSSIGEAGNTIDYTAKVQEFNQLYEAGGGYTDKGGRHYQFYYGENFNGRNTGDKSIYGIYASFPVGP